MKRTLTHRLKAEAQRLGFDDCRVVPVERALHADFFERWLALDRAGEMAYLERHIDKRRDPALLLEDGPARSLVVLAVNYHQFDLPPSLRDDPSRGVIASYAWGDDYHEIIRPLLYQLDEWLRAQTGRTTRGKALVDTGPVLERDWAMRAGVGFIAKNCCTISPADSALGATKGSWLLLATLLIPETLDYDPPPQPHQTRDVAPDEVARGLRLDDNFGSWSLPRKIDVSNDPHWPLTIDNRQLSTGTCGQCTRCLTACPTNAFTGPFHLDPQRCISYWTIEARSPIPRDLRPLFGNRIFGCDICQEVCPWNARLPKRTPRLDGLRARDERVAPPLLAGFDSANPYWLDQEAFSAHFRRSPIKRAKRHGMLRNVCVALGNWGDPATIAPLITALADAHPLPRGHAAWALGQVAQQQGEARIRQALDAAKSREREAWVQEEIELALQLCP